MSVLLVKIENNLNTGNREFTFEYNCGCQTKMSIDRTLERRSGFARDSERIEYLKSKMPHSCPNHDESQRRVFVDERPFSIAREYPRSNMFDHIHITI